MPIPISPLLPKWELQSYSENIDFDCDDLPEPKIRHQTLIFRNHSCKWHIKVTVIGTVFGFRSIKKSLPERHHEFKQFALSIDYTSLPLIADTVTEIEYTLSNENFNSITVQNETTFADNAFMTSMNMMTCEIKEDAKRVVYPIDGISSSLRRIKLEQLQDKVQISTAVFKVCFASQTFVYKEINRMGYLPLDTDNILQEIEALEIFQGCSNIVQAVGIITSTNPYQTDPSSDYPPVITGILLKFYPMGSLELIFEQHEANKVVCWSSVTIQIGEALICMHKAKRTHLNLKLSNIVLDADGNALIIDISGTGSFTWEWLAPEMKKELQDRVDDGHEAKPAQSPFEKQRLNDTWAYGKLLSTIAKKLGGNGLGLKANRVAECLMIEDPKIRMSLENAIEVLRQEDDGKPVANI
ncbi:uncharacterized protein N7479_011271 [Penicillium vulpinum]|uniref:Protein kinase domain-containing protein n=1 Tax=Penicillium vulpinum TaxID=29845 RepID=A0A1V6RY79_9EURO|nr:uncharacterized protein N7479_011271 [Penicillium vulpinum]KAJ5952858.1 hypothetical protein N7479_011271 [Penicillium vulpinum]OQE06450.1 hypothetical protein PENVUL_c018G07333 [Penicillium vulpinum]